MKVNASHIAKLANLPLSKDEEKKLGEQLQETLEYIENLDEIDTKNIEPTSQVTGLENVAREDVTLPSLTQNEALQNTKSVHSGFFKVKGILEND
jgi:aspartyl-tRNA(Asn)/glutamyl-tRNA(Gln) amidotransferase subunit C